MISVPSAPGARPGIGHLWAWTVRPLSLLQAGAATADVFSLRLWRPALVGYQPEWNRAVLDDLDTFRSQGSLSGLSPYLAAGVVRADGADHRDRRLALNPAFAPRAVAVMEDALAEVAAARCPTGTVDTRKWAAGVVRGMLGRVLFGGGVPDPVLASFLAPLDRRLPAPLVPRPRRFARIDAAIGRVLADPPPGTVAAHLAGRPTAGEDLRVALAAGYDTTAHTLAWAGWHLAADPAWADPDALPLFVDEVLRRYPAGWLGSRVAAADTEVTGVSIPAGTLVLYSPFLTHHDPELWPDPARFDPGRFATDHRRGSFLPFATGPRTCLGVHLARRMIHAGLGALDPCGLVPVSGPGRARTGLTLAPGDPLLVRRAGPGRSRQTGPRDGDDPLGGQPA